MSAWSLTRGDCRDVLPGLPAASVDLVLTDPPYPCVKRDYGTWTEEEWFALMRAVVPECMRILKPSGSAIFILQPNSERVGRMRTWLWEFLLWVGKEYGIVQDAYWWNTAAIPEHHSIQGRLMRPSVKACVWVGRPDCYRDQDAALWDESLLTRQRRASARFPAVGRQKHTSGHSVSRATMGEATDRRGGVTPYNLLPVPNSNHVDNGGRYGHSAATPLPLCSWWARYLCPPGGIILDPFSGSGTVGLAALEHGASFIGIEAVPRYHEIARGRLASREKTV